MTAIGASATDVTTTATAKRTHLHGSRRPAPTTTGWFQWLRLASNAPAAVIADRDAGGRAAATRAGEKPGGKPLATVGAGLVPLNSQASKNEVRSSPDSLSASAMNCAVVAVPPWCALTQSCSSEKNAVSPIRTRNALRVMPPRT